MPIISRHGWRIILIGYLAIIGAILWLAYQGDLRFVAAIPFLDKAGHFILLGLLSYISHRASGRRTFGIAGIRLPLAPVVVLCLAAIEEGLQAWSPNRAFDLCDLGMNAAGIFAFWLIDWRAYRKRNPIHP